MNKNDSQGQNDGSTRDARRLAKSRDSLAHSAAPSGVLQLCAHSAAASQHNASALIVQSLTTPNG
jgi:hypothetical protein